MTTPKPSWWHEAREYDIEEILRGTAREYDPTARLIGDQMYRVEYRKGQSHDCDEECVTKNHVFRHEFSRRKMLPLIWFGSDNRSEY